jgi:hypothetical protein
MIALIGCCPYHPAESSRQLHRNMTYPARAALDQHGSGQP